MNKATCSHVTSVHGVSDESFPDEKGHRYTVEVFVASFQDILAHIAVNGNTIVQQESCASAQNATRSEGSVSK